MVSACKMYNNAQVELWYLPVRCIKLVVLELWYLPVICITFPNAMNHNNYTLSHNKVIHIIIVE
jgi:hypothetical protein